MRKQRAEHATALKPRTFDHKSKCSPRHDNTVMGSPAANGEQMKDFRRFITVDGRKMQEMTRSLCFTVVTEMRSSIHGFKRAIRSAWPDLLVTVIQVDRMHACMQHDSTRAPSPESSPQFNFVSTALFDSSRFRLYLFSYLCYCICIPSSRGPQWG